MKSRGLGCVFVLTVFAVSPTFAARLELLNLVDLTQTSHRIFEGRCIKVEHTSVKSRGGGLWIPAVRYTFEILDGIKGVSSPTIQIQQLGHALDGKDFFLKPESLGLPTFNAGQTYLLFMNENGSTGLTSPIGMVQGVFDVAKGLAKNQLGNAHILFGMEEALKTSGYGSLWVRGQIRPSRNFWDDGLELNLFKGLVRELMSGDLKAPSRKELTR